MKTLVQSAQDEIVAAATLLRAGDLVAFPTETVYGLGADARSATAVQKIYHAKGRPPGNPVIVHIHCVEAAKAAAAHWPDIAETLAKHFWPGPLTLILPRGPSLTPLVSAGRSTVALRIPNHPVALELLRQFNAPVAAPSANRSGFTSPTTAAHVLAELEGRIPLILDAGPSTIGLESTVIDISTNIPTILRPGAITLNMLRPLLPSVKTLHASIDPKDSAISPGQHHRHYAPKTPAYRFPAQNWPAARQWADRHAPVVLLSHDDAIHLPAPHETIRLPAEDASYARTLYAALREADERHLNAILILSPTSTTNLWPAITDRLHRATDSLPT